MWLTLPRQRRNWCSRIVLGTTICVLLVFLAGSNRSVDLSYSGQLLAAPSPPVFNAEAQQQAQLERLAREDPLSLFKLARKNYQNSVRDYMCTFVKQERIEGHLKQQETLRVCFKEAPFSVLMIWEDPKGMLDRVLYVAKEGNTTMLIRPAGLAGMLVHTVRRDVHDPKLKTTCLRTPNQFGFGQALRRIIFSYEDADQKAAPPSEYLGTEKVDGRDCLVLSRELPANEEYEAYRLVVFLDKDYLLPTRIEGYDTTGELFSVYTYQGVKFNLGLTDELFSAKANGMDG